MKRHNPEKHKIIASGVHNISWIVDKKGWIVGAIHGTTYMTLVDIMKCPHVHHHYHKYIKEHREQTQGKHT